MLIRVKRPTNWPLARRLGTVSSLITRAFSVSLNLRLNNVPMPTDNWIDNAIELAPERAAEGLVVPDATADSLPDHELVN